MDITKVCVMTSAHSCSDVRIFHKECKSLANFGFDVTLVGPHARDEFKEGVRIVALPKARNRADRFLRITVRLLVEAIMQNARVYHFHDPDLIPIGLLLKALGKKVIYDVHELVYFDIADKDWLKFTAIIIMAQRIYYIFEKIAVKVFDQIILAEDGYLSYFRQHHKSSTKCLTLRNFADLALIDASDPPDVNRKTKPVIIYVGGLSETYGIKSIIKAMYILKDSAELWLLGKWDGEKFMAECMSQKGWKYCRYWGFVPLNEVYSYIKNADVGISILHPLENYLTSLPTKAFEYMACGLPMVMSDFPLWKNIFGECAVFADPHDRHDIAEKISYLLDNPEEAIRLGRRGRELVESKYNWETESKKLVDIYRSLLQ